MKTIGNLHIAYVNDISTIYTRLNHYMSGGQNYLLPAMDMAKVGGNRIGSEGLYFMLRVKIGYRMVSVSGWSPLRCDFFAEIVGDLIS